MEMGIILKLNVGVTALQSCGCGRGQLDLVVWGYPVCCAFFWAPLFFPKAGTLGVSGILPLEKEEFEFTSRPRGS